VWVVRAEADARATYEHNEALRRDGNAHLVDALAHQYPLRPGLTHVRARDLLLSLTGPQQFHYLVTECGWTVAEFRDGVIGAVLRELFGDRLVARSGLPRISLHGAGHAAAILALAAGIPTEVVSGWLDHASVSITQDIYQHAIPSVQEEAGAMLTGLILGGRNA